MRYDYVGSTGREGSGTVLADYEQDNEMNATHLGLCVVYIFIRVNEHQTLQGSIITACMAMTHQVTHSISLLSLKRDHSSFLILAGHGLQDQKTALDACLAQ